MSKTSHSFNTLTIQLVTFLSLLFACAILFVYLSQQNDHTHSQPYLTKLSHYTSPVIDNLGLAGETANNLNMRININNPSINNNNNNDGLMNSMQSAIPLDETCPRKNVSLQLGKRLSLVVIAGLEGSGHSAFGEFRHELIRLWKLQTPPGQLPMMYNYKEMDNDITKGRASHPLARCMRNCWLHDRCLKNETSHNGNRVIEHNLTCFEENNWCTCMRRLLFCDKNYGIDNFGEKSLIFSHLGSYPYGKRDYQYVPNLYELTYAMTLFNKLKNDNNNNKSNNNNEILFHYNLKIVVFFRDYTSMIVANCVHRQFGHITNCINFYPKMIDIFQNQLLSLDKSIAQWIIIDFNDFVQRPLAYTDIFVQFFEIPNNFRNIVFDAIQNAIKPTTNMQSNMTAMDELNAISPDLVEIMNHNFYIPANEKHRWPIFDAKNIVKP